MALVKVAIEEPKQNGENTKNAAKGVTFGEAVLFEMDPCHQNHNGPVCLPLLPCLYANIIKAWYCCPVEINKGDYSD